MNITATSSGLILPPGTRLALLDEAGNIITPDASSQVFSAVVDAYIKISLEMAGEKLTPKNTNLKKIN